MNKCTYCGADIAEDSKFCPSCGKEQVTVEPSIIATEPIIQTEQTPSNVMPQVSEPIIQEEQTPPSVIPQMSEPIIQAEQTPSNEMPQVSEPIIQTEQTPPSVIPQMSEPIIQTEQTPSNVIPQIPEPVIQEQQPTSQVEQPSLQNPTSPMVNVQQPVTNNQDKNKISKELKAKLAEDFIGKIPTWAILLIVMIVSILIGLAIGFTVRGGSRTASSGGIISDSTKTKKYNLGESFQFDGYKITTGKDIEFSIDTNEYSSYKGKDIIKVPVVVQNLNEKVGKLNMFSYKYLGSKGTEVPNPSAFADEDCLDYSGELAPNATSEKLYFYILYDGDGKYIISFDNYTEKATIEFDVKK